MKMDKSKGFSLIELLISMALGVIISWAILDVFVTAKQILFMQQGLARIQESARMVYVLLGEAIESSGKLGCNSMRGELSANVALSMQDHIGFNPLVGLRGITTENLLEIPLSNQVRQKIKPQSHWLLIQSLNQYAELAQPFSLSEQIMYVKGAFRAKPDQIIAISDCNQVNFLRVNQIQEKRSLAKIYLKTDKGDKFSKTYKEKAQVGVWSSRLFYVAKTKRVNVADTPIYALYSTDLNGRTLELIEGVEHMLIQFGVQDQETMQYFSVEEVQDWLKVRKVRVSVLLNSIEDALTKAKVYCIENNEILPQDKLIRMWWHFEWEIKGNSGKILT